MPAAFYALTRREGHSVRDGLRLARMLRKQSYRQPQRTSDALAILGSGASINDLNAEQWDYIRQIDSFGLNFWLVHDFVPTFYMFEGALEPDLQARWVELLNRKAEAYQHTTILLPLGGIYRRAKSICGSLYQLDERLRRQVRPVHNAYVRTENLQLDDFPIKDLLPSHPYGYHPHFRGSLSVALSFAHAMEYETIILYGVDLNRSDYFWSDWSPLPIPRATNHGRPTNAVHMTSSTRFGVGIHEYVYHFNQRILGPARKRLYIGSKNSLLYPTLPYFDAYQPAGPGSTES